MTLRTLNYGNYGIFLLMGPKKDLGLIYHIRLMDEILHYPL